MIRQRSTFRGARSMEVHGYGEFYFYGPECARLYPDIRARYREIQREHYRRIIPFIRTGRALYPGQPWWELDTNLAIALEAITAARDAAIRELVTAMRNAAETDTQTVEDAYNCGESFPFQPCASPLEALIRYGKAA